MIFLESKEDFVVYVSRDASVMNPTPFYSQLEAKRTNFQLFAKTVSVPHSSTRLLILFLMSSFLKT
jgi:hypothetical protein